MSASTPTSAGYLGLSCFAWMIYDYSLTLNDEIELVWTREGYFTKFIFFLLRWSTFGLVAAEVAFSTVVEGYSEAQCDPYKWAVIAGTFFNVVLVEVVLQLRVYVLFNRSRRLLWINAILCTLEVAACGVIAARYYPGAQSSVNVPPQFMGTCYDVRSKAFSTIWVAPTIYELYLTMLVVYKIVDEYRTFGSLEGGILRILARDSIAWFFLMVIVVVANIILWDETVVAPGDTAVTLIHAAGGIGGGRLILNIRAAAARPIARLDTPTVSGTAHLQAESGSQGERYKLRVSENNINYNRHRPSPTP